MGSAAGIEKVSAGRVGLTVEEYRKRIDAGEKWCHAHRAWHPTAEFGKDRSRGDGLAATCLNSRAVVGSSPGARERRLRAAKGERWCRGCEAWLPSADVGKSGCCRPHAAEQYRAYYAKNPGPIKAQKSARARGLDPIPPWWRKERFERFGDLCAYGCQRPAEAIDHIWPVARGGKSVPGNLVPACTSCNSSKKACNPTPWVERGFVAFPEAWDDVAALAILHNTDKWAEEVFNV